VLEWFTTSGCQDAWLTDAWMTDIIAACSESVHRLDCFNQVSIGDELFAIMFSQTPTDIKLGFLPRLLDVMSASFGNLLSKSLGKIADQFCGHAVLKIPNK
jgi:hypothetical protein